MKNKYKIIALITSLVMFSASMLAQGITVGAGVNAGQVNSQSGTSYTVIATDQGKLVTFNNASPVAVTLPNATGQFGSGWFVDTCNYGAGLVTITPTTAQINSASTFTEAQNRCDRIFSDGTNYFASVHLLPGVLSPTAGANKIVCPPPAGTTYWLTDTSANYTQSSACAISANNVRIFCSPGVVIQFTGTTAGFIFSGNNGYVDVTCTLDHNNQSGSGTGPLVKITGGNDNYIQGHFQNVGTTNPQTGTIHVTGGTRVTLDHIQMSGVVDYAVRIEPAASTTLVDFKFTHSNIGCDHTSGFPVWQCVFATDVTNSNSAVQGGVIEDVTIHDNGANSTALELSFNLSGAPFESSSSYGWRIVNNNCVLDGRIDTCYHTFGFYKSTFANNTGNDNSNIIVNMYACGDCYDDSITGNSFTMQSAAGTSCITLIDFARDSVSGNVCNGGGYGAGNGAFKFLTVGAGSNGNTAVSGNHAYLPANGAGGCYQVGTSNAFALADMNFTGNSCFGSGFAGQLGFGVAIGSGGISHVKIGESQITNVPTGYSIGASVSATQLGATDYDTVTTQVSDSGTGTSGVTHTVRGTCTLGTNCAVTLAQGGFSASTSYQCQATDTTAAAATKVVNTSATVATFTGTGTDVLAYTCSGF